jgi:hypothetical protein
MKISETLKTFPTIMSIGHVVKIMNFLEKLDMNEIIQEKEIFIEILWSLYGAYHDIYVLEDDVRLRAKNKNFIEWLKKIQKIEELNCKYFEETIDDLIGVMGVVYPKDDRRYKLEKLFTDEEFEYICISSLAEQEIHGKKYYIMERWKDIESCENYDSILLNENKMVCEVIYKQIASQENNYQYKYEITSTNIKLIDYLR